MAAKKPSYLFRAIVIVAGAALCGWFDVYGSPFEKTVVLLLALIALWSK